MMTSFVLLRHECPPHFEKPSHWDLMFEMDGVLRTWELRELPAAWLDALAKRAAAAAALAKRMGVGPGVARTSIREGPAGRGVMARQLEDHRLEYLDYEGPLTGDRGTVCRCERGTYELLSSNRNGLALLLSGETLRQQIELTRCGPSWRLVLAGESR